MKILITGSSKFPVPAVQGGAVPNLIEELIQQQEIDNKIDLYCCSLWDEKAEKKSKKYTKTTFIWAKVPKWIHKLDHILTWILKNVFRIQRLLSIGFLFQVIWFTFYIGKIIHQEKFDKIIFENSVPMLFAMKMYFNKKKYKDKYYIHMHSVPRKYYGNERVFSNCKGLISISQYVADEICADKRVDISKDQIKLMYNCVDIEKFDIKNNVEIEALKEKYGILPTNKVVLFAGRMCKDKGIEEVIQVMKKLGNKDVKLLVVGANFYNSGIVSPYEQHLRNLAEDIRDQIVFTGYVPYSKMPLFYNMGDVVVLPSIWDEPAGMTMLESMACKRPLITTISGGIPEYVGKGNCILVERDEKIIDSLLYAVNQLLDDNVQATKMAEAGYLRARRYNRKYYYDQFLKIVVG